MIRKALVIPLLAALSLASGGCLPFTEVDELAFVISVTLDKSDVNRIKVGVKYPVPRLVGKVQGGAIGGGTSSQLREETTTVDAPTILDGISAMQLYTGRQINLEHARLVVVGEELARQGIGAEIESLMRYPQTRSNMHIAVVRGDASRLSLENQPSIDANIARFIDLQSRAADITGLSIVTRIGDFYNHLRDPGSDMVTGIWAINEKVLAARTAEEREMAGGPTAPSENADKDIERKQSLRYGEQETAQEPAPLFRTPGSYESGELTREGGNVVEWCGLAVFRQDRMIGELNGNESIAYRLLSGNLQRATFSVAEIDNSSNIFAVEISQARKPVVSIKTAADGTLHIKVALYIEGNLLMMTNPETMQGLSSLAVFEQSLTNSLRVWIDSTLRKTQGWGSDIYGFGNYYRRNFLTWHEWEEYNWSEHFKEAVVQVELKTSIRRTGLLLDPVQ